MSTSEKLFFMSAIYTVQFIPTEWAFGIGLALFVLGAVVFFVERSLGH